MNTEELGSSEKDKLSIYDAMMRNEIQIRAEKEFAVEQARAEALAKGKAEGEAKGKAEGKADAQREIAAKLKATGADPEFISEITGMTVEDISML